MLASFADFTNFPTFIREHKINFTNDRFNNLFQDFHFYYISDKKSIETIEHQQMEKNIKISDLIIIDHIQIQHQEHILFGFEKTLIIIFKQFINNFLSKFLAVNPDLTIYLLSNAEDIFIENYPEKLNYHLIKNDAIFIQEITNLKENIFLFRPEKETKQIFSLILPCISAYLIKKSYFKLKQNRIDKYLSKEDYEISEFKSNDFVELRKVGCGSLFCPTLIYHIERGELYVIKEPNCCDNEITNLINREKNNYLEISHPFLPKYYGTLERKNHIVIEYINGQTLDDIKEMQLTDNEKITIIFELMMLLNYFHSNKFIYRDLKLNNVIIDENKTAVLIDFDRLIKIDENSDDNEHTLNFASAFVAPEINISKKFTFKSDIYSLGKLMDYLMKETETDAKICSRVDIFVERCTNEFADKRPTILELIYDFYSEFRENIEIDHLYDIDKEILNLIDISENDLDDFIVDEYVKSSKMLFKLGMLYLENNEVPQDIDKSIYYLSFAAIHGHYIAQFNLGVIYQNGEYVPQDINKAIYYFSLASNNHHPKAQFLLGFIYNQGKYVPVDINKAIYYYSLAADQNFALAQYHLGVIYYENKYIARDIAKAIHYFTLAADQNILEAQFSLGLIYSTGEFVDRDIKLSIHYYSLCADRNYSDANLNLGTIYYEGELVQIDINKAIKYFTRAANQNNSMAQYNLGIIYSQGYYVTRDINKAIYYFTCAANQNDINAQYQLGAIYFEGKYSKHDMSLAIFYFTLAANQNNISAQLMLGYIYGHGCSIEKDIKKAIHYFSLAASLGNPRANFELSIIYFQSDFIERDTNKAIYYLEVASNLKFPYAHFKLGVLYEKGLYIAKDMNKAIHYYILAANSNIAEAQINLGVIFEKGDYVQRDINKALHYFLLAAEQKLPEAFFNIGLIYLNGEYVQRDIQKIIHYFTIAADQNHPLAQYNLGVLFLNGQHVTRDVNKAIYYFTLAANQNLPQAQFCLGSFYENGISVQKDINKAIQYYLLAANQNYSQAQFSLGLIYHTGEYIIPNINKAIHYYSLAADQNNPYAQYFLGIIYLDSIIIKRDTKKAIHYFQLAANANYSSAQFCLGIYYYEGLFIHQDIKKGIYLLNLSSINKCKNADFVLGYLYHEGKNIKKDINQAIRFYKEASSFNNSYAKNNLGIIYEFGFGKEIESNTAHAIVYFNEAIQQKHDYLSMFNLAHIYLYDETNFYDINKSIDLLIKSSNQFIHSLFLLCIALIKKYGFEIEKNKKEIEMNENLSNNLSFKIHETINFIKLNDKATFENLYECYKSECYLYNHLFQCVSFLDFQKTNDKSLQKKNNYSREISSIFYEGFGINLLD